MKQYVLKQNLRTKSCKFDDFNEVEEKEVKERVKK